MMVKYADGPTTSVEVEINAGADTVWPLITDINLPGRFSDEFVRAEWTSDGPAPGATFTGHNHRDDFGDWNVPCTVTDFEPQRTFEWTIGDVANKVARWRFDVAPTDNGSRLTFSAEMGPGPSGLTPAIERMPDREEDIVARRLEQWTANMQRTAEGIKELAEQAVA